MYSPELLGVVAALNVYREAQTWGDCDTRRLIDILCEVVM